MNDKIEQDLSTGSGSRRRSGFPGLCLGAFSVMINRGRRGGGSSKVRDNDGHVGGSYHTNRQTC